MGVNPTKHQRTGATYRNKVCSRLEGFLVSNKKQLWKGMALHTPGFILEDINKTVLILINVFGSDMTKKTRVLDQIYKSNVSMKYCVFLLENDQ